MTLSQLSWKVQGWGLVLLTFLSFFPVLFHVEEYLFFGILIVLTGGTFWWEGKFVLPRSPIDVPLILFVVWVSLTLPFSAHPAYSFSEWLKLVAQVLVFYWTLLVLMKAQSRYFSRWVLAAVVCGAAVINGHSLIEYVVSHGALLWPGQVRIDFFHSSAQWLVTYGVIALPLIVAAGAIVKGAYYRFLCAFVFGVTMVGGAYAMSRAGWLAVMVQAGTFGIMGKLRRVGLSFLVCGLLGAGSLVALSQIGHRTSMSDSLLERFSFWELAGQEILHHPLVGLGYGNDTLVRVFALDQDRAPRSSTHNAFLSVAVGSGIPAITFLVWILAKAFWVLTRNVNFVSDVQIYAIRVGIAIMIIGFAVRNVFDNMFAGSLAYLFWILLATGLSQLMVKEQVVTLLGGNNSTILSKAAD